MPGRQWIIRVLHQVLVHYQMIVIGNMGELGASFTISQGIDPRDIGLQAIVNSYKTGFVHFDTGGGQVEGFYICFAASGDQQVRAGDGGAAGFEPS